MHKQLLVLIFLLLGFNIQAQDENDWTLEKCINYAIQNSLQVQQATLNQSQAKLNKRQAIWAQAPTLNGSFRHGVNFGRSLDPTTYELVFTPTQSSSLALNVNAILFQGFQIRNGIKQSKVDLEAAAKDVEQAKNDVALSVAQSYLSILLATESKEVLEEQSKVTIAQYAQTTKLIKAGVLAENSKYDLEAQMARDEENIVNAQNSMDLAYVNLKVLMNLDVSEKISIQRIKDLQVGVEEEEASLEEVYKEAIKNQPNILASKLRERSAELGVKIAKGAMWPTVSLYGGIGTNFSSNFKDPRSYTYLPDTAFGVVASTGETTHMYGARIEPGSGSVLSYFEQLGSSVNGNVGINVSVPIFNGFRTRINIQRSELAIKAAELATTQLETTLKSSIERSLTDVKAAEKRLAAATKSVTAIRLSVENTRKRYELGVVNSFELTSVQNTLIASESNLLQAKYDYLFKLKILDYYRGRPISIQ